MLIPRGSVSGHKVGKLPDLAWTDLVAQYKLQGRHKYNKALKRVCGSCDVLSQHEKDLIVGIIFSLKPFPFPWQLFSSHFQSLEEAKFCGLKKMSAQKCLYIHSPLGMQMFIYQHVYFLHFLHFLDLGKAILIPSGIYTVYSILLLSICTFVVNSVTNYGFNKCHVDV